jgi:hypothetical protein
VAIGEIVHKYPPTIGIKTPVMWLIELPIANEGAISEAGAILHKNVVIATSNPKKT